MSKDFSRILDTRAAIARRVREPLTPSLRLAAVTACGCASVALLLAVSRRLAPVVVRGSSMEPTLRDGDRLLVRRGHPLTRGQIVVVEWTMACRVQQRALDGLRARETPEQARNWFIKRIAALPGDLVPRDRAPALADVPEQRVPAGRLVLLGDNPDMSVDSRQVGYFHVEHVLGVATRYGRKGRA